MFNKLIKRRLKTKMQKEGFDFYEANENVINNFRDNVKGNSKLSDLEILKKINRDFFCSRCTTENFTQTTRYYGFLQITYDRLADRFVYIYNQKHKYTICGKIDYELKEKLNKILNIK